MSIVRVTNPILNNSRQDLFVNDIDCNNLTCQTLNVPNVVYDTSDLTLSTNNVMIAVGGHDIRQALNVKIINDMDIETDGYVKTTGYKITNSGFTTTIDTQTLTADRTITLPNTSGVIPIFDQSLNTTNDVLFNSVSLNQVIALNNSGFYQAITPLPLTSNRFLSIPNQNGIFAIQSNDVVFSSINLNSGTKNFQIDGTDVLTATTLGSGVVNSSITSNTGALTNTGLINTTSNYQIGGNTFIHNTGTGCSFVGVNVSDTGNVLNINNTAMGFEALKISTNIIGNSYNTAVGAHALKVCASGADNTCVGDFAGATILNGIKNTLIGRYAGNNSVFGIVGGSRNVCVGWGTGNAYFTTESDNIIIGYNIPGTLGENSKTRIGNIDGTSVGTTGNLTMCQSSGTLLGTSATGDVGITAEKLVFKHQSSPSVYQLVQGYDTGNDRGYIYSVHQGSAFTPVFIGQSGGAGVSNLIGSGSITAATSMAAGTSITAGTFMTVGTNYQIGGSVFAHNNGISDTFVGINAGNTGTGGASNCAVGFNALSGMGTSASITDNTAIGAYSMAGTLTNTGIQNTCVGSSSGRFITDGTQNTCIGRNAGSNGSTDGITTGIDNTLIGYSAGSDYTGAENNNTILGAAINGTVGESNVIRIGNTLSGALPHCYINGLQSGVVGGSAVFIVPGTGELTYPVSSARYKENIKSYSDDDKFMLLEPVSFNYKNDKTKEIQYGLIAEDVNDIYPEMVLLDKEGVIDSVQYHKLTGILIAALQSAHKKINQLIKIISRE